jgi:PAS domain S-box-containing protein
MRPWSSASSSRPASANRVWQVSEDLLVLADYEGRLLRVSPSWSRLLGHREATLLTTHYADLIHPDDLDAVLGALAEMRASGRAVRFEDRVRAADGSWRWISWTLSPEPAGERLHGVGRDVTAVRERAEALRQAEEALRQAQKMEAVGQLTGGIAHDFNNLLQGIVGGLELLRRRVDEGRLADARRFADGAAASAQRAAALVQRLLAFSRRQPLDPRPVDANRLVASMEELLRRTLGPGIGLETVLSGGLWPALCDPNGLESALLNLAINARDAMPEGGRLTVETQNAYLDDAYARARGGDLRPGPVRRGERHRHRRRHGARRGGQGLRPVLHHQARRPGHRPRPLDPPRLREAVGRARRHPQRGRPRHDRRHLPAGAQRERARARRARRRGALACRR